MISRSPALVFYVSGHGFGHASRDIEVINALHAIAPGVRLVVRTSAPRWLFDLTLACAGYLAPGRVRHGSRPDRQPASGRVRDGAASGRTRVRARRDGGARGAAVARAAGHPGRRRHSSACVPFSAPRGRAVHRAWQLHLGLDLCRLSGSAGRAPHAAATDSQRLRARGARMAAPARRRLRRIQTRGAGAVHRPAIGPCRRRTFASGSACQRRASWCWPRSADMGCGTSTWARSRRSAATPS